MMERAYREDELLDSIVIDSEGYIYGMIGEVEVKEKEVDLLIYETKPDEKTVIDNDTLIQKLLERVDLTLSAKISQEILLKKKCIAAQFLVQVPTSSFLICPTTQINHTILNHWYIEVQSYEMFIK